MPLTPQEDAFLDTLYRNASDKPLETGDPRYEPLYAKLGELDPVHRLAIRIKRQGPESRQLFSGFRGSGKSTELRRLKKYLEEQGYVVYFADAMDYLNPALPVDITQLLILLAGAFSDSVQEAEGKELAKESFWAGFVNYLNNTQIKLNDFDLKLFDVVTLKGSLKDVPNFRDQLRDAMSRRLSELKARVDKFFEDIRKEIDRIHTNAGVVFLFDNLEQLRGNALSEEQEVLASVEKLFSNHLDLLAIPYIHVVYTVPPWLQFAIPGLVMEILPSIVQWENDTARSLKKAGRNSLLHVLKKRFPTGGFERFFGSEKAALPLVDSCGGNLRDLLLLLRETIVSTGSFPVSNEAVQSAISKLRNSLRVTSTEDAKWLNRIAESRKPELPDQTAKNIFRFTAFVDTHLVLFLRNGQEWYDVHPLLREYVAEIVRGEAEREARREAEKGSSV
jgi:hypothetical protein